MICLECGLEFYQITASHLRSHNLTTWEYRIKYPGCSFVSDSQIRTSIGNFTNHSGICSDPIREEERRTRISDSLTGITRSPETCKILSDRPTGWQSTDEAREANSVGLKLWWSNPSNREARLRSIFKGCKGNPNNSESDLLLVLEDLDPGKWAFNSGSFILGGRVPDFIRTDSSKLLIELFGEYWHEESEVESRILLYARYGYRLLVVWDYEVCPGDLDLETKLKAFIGLEIEREVVPVC